MNKSLGFFPRASRTAHFRKTSVVFQLEDNSGIEKCSIHTPVLIPIFSFSLMKNFSAIPEKGEEFCSLTTTTESGKKRACFFFLLFQMFGSSLSFSKLNWDIVLLMPHVCQSKTNMQLYLARNELNDTVKSLQPGNWNEQGGQWQGICVGNHTLTSTSAS